MSIPDVGPLAILIVLLFAAAGKFYWAVKNHSWLAFADGMARIGLGGFYLSNYLAGFSGSISGSDQSRALARLGIIAVFLIEAIPWMIGLCRKRGKL